MAAVDRGIEAATRHYGGPWAGRGNCQGCRCDDGYDGGPGEGPQDGSQSHARGIRVAVFRPLPRRSETSQRSPCIPDYPWLGIYGGGYREGH